MKDAFTVIDLFAGAGGLSEGFLRNGYRFTSYVEMDRYASMTLETRAIYHVLKANKMDYIYSSYIRGEISKEKLINEGRTLTDYGTVINAEISAKNRNAIIRKVENNLRKANLKNVDIIIGGPPCQTFSIIGRGRNPEKMKNDPRNDLYFHYISFISHFRPSAFVFENVPGIKSALNGKIYSNILLSARKLGYVVLGEILDAKDFFVLQKRQRVIIIGLKTDRHFEYPSFKPVKHDYAVSQLLEDLPPLVPGNGKEGPQKYLGPPSDYLRKSGIRTESDILIQHRARKHNERDREIYRYVIKAWNIDHRRLRYDELPDNLKTHKNIISFLDRFKVVAPDLKYAHTITAHSSKDGHYYIHPDINQARSITVREAARIQSFPDNYKFEGPMTSQYRQIGNAVPPLMAERIAIEIKNMLDEI